MPPSRYRYFCHADGYGGDQYYICRLDADTGATASVGEDGFIEENVTAVSPVTVTDINRWVTEGRLA